MKNLKSTFNKYSKNKQTKKDDAYNINKALLDKVLELEGRLKRLEDKIIKNFG